jgi:hypothetical protein
MGESWKLEGLRAVRFEGDKALRLEGGKAGGQ